MAKIETVRGPIPAEELGVTLAHEHLLVDLTCEHVLPAERAKLSLVDASVSMDILGELRRDPLVCLDNLKLSDLNDAKAEVLKYKMAGGNSIVDVTVPGMGRDHVALREISNATGLHIIAATGFFIGASHPPIVRQKSVEELCDMMVKELAEGIGDTDVKAAVIKSALSYPALCDEEKVVRAAARAQARVGVPFTVHPPLWDTEKKTVVKKVGDILETIQKEGADLGKFYQSHMDATCTDLDYQRRIIDQYGIILAYDGFGEETYIDSFYPGRVLTAMDSERISALAELCKRGYEKNLMMSSDVCFKMMWTKYGGYGYAHVLKHIVPALEFAGVTSKQVHTMMVGNPRRLFAR